MTMSSEAASALKEKALAAFLRTDGAQAESAEVVKFEDLRRAGNYVILRTAGEVVAVYKQDVRFGPPKVIKAIPGRSAGFEVTSMSVGVKRIKRWPPNLVKEKA
jgi:hypothetical protein